MGQIAFGALERLLGRVQAVAVDSVIFVVTFLIVYLAGRFLLLPVVKWTLEKSRVDDTFRLSVQKVVHGVLGLFAALVAAVASGLATYLTATSAITAGLAIAFGFAAQDVLGNFVSGVFIVLDPEFHVGDWIQWNDREGIVEDISFRVTRVHTFDNELITVPNGELTGSVVVNPAAKDRVRVRQTFGVGYGESVDAAEAILLAVAREHGKILDRPGPTSRLVELGDSAIHLEVRFWIASPARADLLRIRSEYVQTVTDRFDAAEIEMPYPYRQLTGELTTYAGELPE